MVAENISNNPLDQRAGHGQDEPQKNHFSKNACCSLCFALRFLSFPISCREGFEKPSRGFEKPSRGRPTRGELSCRIASNGRSVLLQCVPHPGKRISAFHRIIYKWLTFNVKRGLLKLSLPCLWPRCPDQILLVVIGYQRGCSGPYML